MLPKRRSSGHWLVRRYPALHRGWSELDNICLRVPLDALHRPRLQSGDVALATGMMAQVLLAGSLSRDVELDGDLRPANALPDRGVDEAGQLVLSLVSLDPDVLDPFQQFWHRRSSDRLRRTRMVCGLLVVAARLYAFGFRSRLALRSAHATSMWARTDMLERQTRADADVM